MESRHLAGQKGVCETRSEVASRYGDKEWRVMGLSAQKMEKSTTSAYISFDGTGTHITSAGGRPREHSGSR